MTTMKTRAALVALVMIAVGSVSACGSNPIKNAVDDAVGNAVENGVENAVGAAAGEDVDIDMDGSGASLPDSFPADIPRPDVTLTGAFASGESWTLAYAPTDASTVEALVAEYGSGWTVQSESDFGELKSWAFTSDAYFVTVGAIQNDDEWTISISAVAVTE